MIPIMGLPTVRHMDVVIRATKIGADPWYFKALIALWDAGREWGVDPLVMAAQCAHETNWGRFGGAVTPDMGNTCGLKTRTATGDRKQDHASFPMRQGFPVVGAVAHAHHLRCYAGWPVPADTPDPRSSFVGPGTKAFGKAKIVEQLSGAWAPSSQYGAHIINAYIELGGIYALGGIAKI
jgi:hypothetical protein